MQGRQVGSNELVASDRYEQSGNNSQSLCCGNWSVLRWNDDESLEENSCCRIGEFVGNRENGAVLIYIACVYSYRGTMLLVCSNLPPLSSVVFGEYRIPITKTH